MVAAVVAAATAATVQASLGTGEIAASPPSRRGLRDGHGWQRSQKRGVQTTSSTVYSTSRLVLLNFLNMCLNPCPFPFTAASTASFVVVNDDSYIQRTVFSLQLKKQSQPQTYQMPIPLVALAEALITLCNAKRGIMIMIVMILLLKVDSLCVVWAHSVGCVRAHMRVFGCGPYPILLYYFYYYY